MGESSKVSEEELKTQIQDQLCKCLKGRQLIERNHIISIFEMLIQKYGINIKGRFLDVKNIIIEIYSTMFLKELLELDTYLALDELNGVVWPFGGAGAAAGAGGGAAAGVAAAGGGAGVAAGAADPEPRAQAQVPESIVAHPAHPAHPAFPDGLPFV